MKMWLFPGLSVLTAAAIAAVLVQMAVTPGTQISLTLSCLSWVLVLGVYLVVRKRGGSVTIAQRVHAEAPSSALIAAE